MNDAIRQPTQRLGKARDFILRKAVLLEHGNAFGKVERVAGKDDLKLDLVVKIGLRERDGRCSN